jgi:16S rRNA A1518/A1519 N6-dimethyltransferase RsmA/KsgA/DIM1 with predicted DNA glycosylase/AP lyase activity
MNLSNIKTNNNYLLDIKNIIKNIPNYQSYILIDIGCGYGLTLKELSMNKIKSIGIELDKKTAEMALMNKSKLMEIVNINMIDYKFKNNKMIIYLYEPLFMIYKMKATILYYKLLENISKIKETIYIIYLSGIYRRDLEERLLNSFGFELIYKKDYLIRELNVYIYKPKKR